MKQTYTIHDLPFEERPRERLQSVGVKNLSLQELLTIIIERGEPGQSALTIAQNLLSHFGNAARIKEATLEELQEVKDIGLANACKIQAALKFGEKAQNTHKRYNQKIESAEDVFKLLKNKIGSKKKEHFKLLSLDTRNRLISIDDISVGTVNASLAHPREIFRPAIKNNAVSIILAHNHPSGNTDPSNEDLKISQTLIKASKVLDIDVVDHIIITKESFTSLKDRGDI